MGQERLNRILVQQNVHRSGGGFFSRFGGGNKRFSGKKTPGDKFKSFLGYAAILFLALLLAGSVAGVAMFAWFSRELPDPNNISKRAIAQTTKIFDRTGKNLLYEIHGDEKRTIVNLDQIANDAKHATIAVEDKDFYEHHGFKLTSIIRSLIKDILSGNRAQGGSTITQQFIKNAVLTREKTLTRKIKEFVLSIELERRFSKDEILKLYLNEIPYGSVAYGIEAASQTFFGKHAKDLTLSESAILASLPQAPTYYSPYGTHRDGLLRRSHLVLDLMVQQGYVTAEQAEEAKKDDVLARVLPHLENITAPHFVFYVKEQLAQQFGEDEVERGGFNVMTTLDVEKQKLAEKAIDDNLESLKKYNGNTAAMMAMDPKNGEILAMVGSADFFDDSIDGKFNAITAGKLQPGSSIKPLVYAAAFEKGYTPNTVLFDVVTSFSTGSSSYTPHDYDLGERGPVTLKEALAGSLNIPAVKVLYLVGLEKFSSFAERLGYTTLRDKSRYGLSLVLGGAEIRPVEHIAAFSAFAQEGTIRPTKSILKITDINGEVLLDNSTTADGKRVLDPEISRQVTDILSDNAARASIFGERNFLTLADRPVAAKTGTTNEFKDAWTIGYTPSLVTGVWTGNADGSVMKRGADGSKVAAPIWNQFMRSALTGTAVEAFTAPQPVVTGKPVLDGQKTGQTVYKVDKTTGKIATEFTPPELVEERSYGKPHEILHFVDKDNPRGPAPEHPEKDPQYASWEKAVTEWATKKGIVFADPPTEYDTEHNPADAPVVSFTSPQNNAQISERTFTVSLDATAPNGITRADFTIDDTFVRSITSLPLSGGLYIPSSIAKGFHTLTVKVYDPVGNVGRASITINVTAEQSQLGVSWVSPAPYQVLNRSAQFPLTVTFVLDSPKLYSLVRVLYGLSPHGEDGEVIGEISNPNLQTLSVRWQNAGNAGTYYLTIEAIKKTGEKISESLPVIVQ